jgi:hypothetical protein
MAWFSASDPSQKTIFSGLVSRAASATQASIGVATINPRKFCYDKSEKQIHAHSTGCVTVPADSDIF